MRALSFLFAVADAAKVDGMSHDIQLVSPQKIAGELSTVSSLTVASVLYFDSSKDSQSDIDMYNEVATKTKGMLKVMALDCNAPAGKKHCDREGVKETPHVMIYPQAPQPKYKYGGKMESGKIYNHLMKKIPADKVNHIKTKAEFNALKNKNPSKPKVFLFSDKEDAPAILKGLTTHTVFQRSVEFGFVGKGSEAAAEVGKKKTPAIMMYLTEKKKSMWYKGDMKFLPIYEWISPYSESGMGDTTKGAGGKEVEAEEQPYEKVRELHIKSQHDLCGSKQKNMCAVYISDGTLDDKIADEITTWESSFSSSNDRGLNFSWMWIDASVETDVIKVIKDVEKKQAEKAGEDYEALKLPTFIFVKPAKKKRDEKFFSFVRLANGAAVDKDAVGNLIEKVASGTTYSRADVPTYTPWAQRQKDAPKKAKEEL